MNVVEALRGALRPHLSPISVESLVQRHVRTPTYSVQQIPAAEREQLLERIASSVSLFSKNDPKAIRADVRTALGLDEGANAAGVKAEIPIRVEVDVSVARNEARRVATAVGATATMAVKVATAVSELARNIILYAGQGAVELDGSVESRVAVVRVVARDAGPGVPKDKLESIFGGSYRSKTGLGKGLAAVKRIADEFAIDSSPGEGTTVRATFRGVG